MNLDDSVDEDNVGPDGSLLPTASSPSGTDLSVRRHALEQYWDLVGKGKKKSVAKTVIAKYYKVDPRTIARWIQNESAIQSTPAGAKRIRIERPMTDLRESRLEAVRERIASGSTGMDDVIAALDALSPGALSPASLRTATDVSENWACHCARRRKRSHFLSISATELLT